MSLLIIFLSKVPSSVMRHSKLFASLTANAIPPGSKQEVENAIPPGTKQEVEPETVPQPAVKRVKGQAKAKAKGQAKATDAKPKAEPSKKRSLGRI